MSTVDKAAEVLAEYLVWAVSDPHYASREATETLAAAGLLVTPEHDAAVWDEGFSAGYKDRNNWGTSLPRPKNPYREEQP